MQDFEYQNKEEKEVLDEEIFDELLDRLNILSNSLDSSIQDYANKSYYLNCKIKSIKEVKKRIKKNIAVVLASLGILTSIPIYVTSKLTTNWTLVPLTTYTYEEGKLPQAVTKYVPLSNDLKEKKYIVLMEPYNKLNYRNTTAYDVSDIDLSSPLEYYDLDLSKINDKIKSVESKTEKTEDNENIQSKKLIIEKIDFNDKKKDESISFLLASFYGIYIFLLSVFEVIYSVEISDGYLFIVSKIKKIKDGITIVGLDKSELNKIKEQLNEVISQINEIISQSEELSRKWNEEFERNKDLMSDPSLLLSKYDELIESIKTKCSNVKLERKRYE